MSSSRQRIIEMIRNTEETIRMLQDHARWLRGLADELGVALPHAEGGASELRAEMERMRHDIIARAEEDRQRVMRDIKAAAANARTGAAMAGAPHGASSSWARPMEREDAGE